MKADEFNNIQDKIFSDIKILRDKKGHDYATNEDTLRNFKVVSEICRLLAISPAESPSDVCLFYEVVKLARQANLKHKEPQNESVADTVADLINYTCLWLGCKEDEKRA